MAISRSSLARWHRRIALAFAPALLALIVSGLVLAFRPVTRARANAVVDPARLAALIARVDPGGTAMRLALPDEAPVVVLVRDDVPARAFDLATGKSAPVPRPRDADLFEIAEQVHRNLWFGLGGIVTIATMALLALAALGPLLAPLRRPRSPLGWHSAIGWLSWPLVVLLPFTAVVIVLPIGRPSGFRASQAPLPFAEALPAAARLTDLSRLRAAQRMSNGGLFIITEGDDGPQRAIVVDGVVHHFGGRFVRRMRALHVGDWGGPWGRVLAALSASLLLALGVTGTWSWWRRRAGRARAERAVTETLAA